VNWNPDADLNHADKAKVLVDYFDRYGPFRYVLETGIWQGQGSCYQFEPYAEVVAIESDPESAALAREAGHDVRTGDSAYLLGMLLASRDAPAFFWLDAHLVAEAGETNYSPLMWELAAIRGWPHAAGSCVLIDDVRMMGREGWPSLDAVLAVADPWDIDVSDDIVRLTPKSSI